jgi:hypothetical protein
VTIELSDFPNVHGRNDHFGHDHNTIFDQMVIVKWSKLTDISKILWQKKSGIVDMVNIKYGLTILTMKVL